jgi:hemerythrin-like domain-containing protein
VSTKREGLRPDGGRRYRQFERGEAAASGSLVECALHQLCASIMKDNVLFPMGDRVLTPDDQRQLVEEFEEVERKEMGEGVHERYHAMLDELERELNIV